MKLADALVTSLRDWGLQYLFGVSGANIEHLHDAVHRLGGSEFRSIMAKSEVGAACMADCRARVHRTLGVCCSTSGGGMMNLAVGIAESFSESVPVLAIIGQPPTHLEGRGAFQDSSGIGRSVDGVKFWKSISKFCRRISCSSDFWPVYESAVRAAMSGRQGPAVLLIPRDLFDCEVDDRAEHWPESVQDLIQLPIPTSESLQQLADAIECAETPVLLLGTGVDRSTDPQAVRRFATQAGIPVATTLANKGTFPNDDSLYLGTAGMAGEPAVHDYLRHRSDLIVAVGTGLNVMTRQPLADALTSEKLAVVNIDVEQFDRIVSPSIIVHGDAGQVFQCLSDLFERAAIPRRPPATLPSVRFTPTLAEPMDEQSIDSLRSDTGAEDLLQSAAIEILQDFIPGNGHIIFDAGNCAAAAIHYLQVPPQVSTTIALGMGGMGYSISGAIGAQLGSPEGSRTIVFCGDGSYLMSGMEVHTAVHYELPILYVIFNNNMHGMCVTRQQLYFDSRIECATYPEFSAARVASGLATPDRLWTGQAENGLELTDQLISYFDGPPRPGLLELKLRREQVPPFTPFLPDDAPTEYVPAARDVSSKYRSGISGR